MLKTNYMRNLNSEDIDLSITISGMLIRMSHLLPEMQKSFCNARYASTVPWWRWTMAESLSSTWVNADPQSLCVLRQADGSNISSLLENKPARQMFHAVILFTHNDLVDKVQPGDRVNSTDID